MLNEEKKESEKKDKQNIPFDNNTSASNKSFYPIIAGIILIIAGALALLSYITILTIDNATFESIYDISQFQSFNPNITIEDVKEIMNLCAIIGCILSVIALLGGILSIKKKLWGIAIVCSLVGVFTFGPMLISSILCFIALFFIATSRQEFH